MKKMALILSTSLILQSCGLAPWASDKTARTLGKGTSEFQAGFATTPYLWYSQGLSDNLDIVVGAEVQGIGELSGLLLNLGTKYAFVQSEDSFSIAFTGGVFFTEYSKGVYAGPILSIKTGWYEPYLQIKYNHVNWNGTDESAEDDFVFGDADSLKDDVAFDYFFAVAGANFWFTDNFALNVNAKYIASSNEDTSDEGENALPSISIIWRF